MQLKEYQQKSLDQVKGYLQALEKYKQKADRIRKEEEVEIDFPKQAWEKLEVPRPFNTRKTGTGEYLPSFCLKIPTGGGKTLLAVKAIDLINDIYLQKQTGLVLWVVPSTQIYNQTIRSLRDRDHPYRQFLDIASSGHTLIKEKADRFTPTDVSENLVVMMLMLPSANRKTKDVLRIFKDNGGFEDFFPYEDDRKGHEELLEEIPNLGTFDEDGFWGHQIKTSLGNTIKLLNPILILDEGHKAYSVNARKTLNDFNPSTIVELSATPSDEVSNILVDIKGIELEREEMIKLDLHIYNKASTDWKDTLLSSVNHRDLLEEKAQEYEANSGNYIRPINLIQVERTGKSQRGKGYIHAEDVREHLINVVGITEDQIAVKTSEKDELKEIDEVEGLMSRESGVRYIITKQALQEGWDCPFAYVLTILTNPQSKTALTQLVGRVLRQPNARKTGVKELDESYVFVFQQDGVRLLREIKAGFEQEGLGDLASDVVGDEGFDEEELGKRKYQVREKFRKSVTETVLPVFVMQGEDGWREVNYEMDIAQGVDWEKLDLSPLYDLTLSEKEEKDIEHIAGLTEDIDELVTYRGIQKLRQGALRLDPVFMTRHLLDVTSNPWLAHEVTGWVLDELLDRHDRKKILNNFVFIIEETRKHLATEKDRLSEEVFRALLKQEKLKFMVIGENLGFRLPKKETVSSRERTLTTRQGEPLQHSLFEFVPEKGLNELEKKVAWYLEGHERMFFWYRNIPKRDYAVQGWRKNKIYPDFIFTTNGEGKSNYEKAYVLETKGLHLKNEDTAYKQEVFEICNQYAQEKSLSELSDVWKDKEIQFKVVFGDEWKSKLNEMLEASR